VAADALHGRCLCPGACLRELGALVGRRALLGVCRTNASGWVEPEGSNAGCKPLLVRSLLGRRVIRCTSMTPLGDLAEVGGRGVRLVWQTGVRTGSLS